jgi:hypothetical protein
MGRCFLQPRTHKNRKDVGGENSVLVTKIKQDQHEGEYYLFIVLDPVSHKIDRMKRWNMCDGLIEM